MPFLDLLIESGHLLKHFGTRVSDHWKRRHLVGEFWVFVLTAQVQRSAHFVNPGSQHLDGGDQTTLMTPSRPGERKLIGVVDALALSRLSLFARPNLKDPTKGPQDQAQDE